ncbi:MAG: hypothetical protein ACOCVC_01140 [Spirochaeta sp.]
MKNSTRLLLWTAVLIIVTGITLTLLLFVGVRNQILQNGEPELGQHTMYQVSVPSL